MGQPNSGKKLCSSARVCSVQALQNSRKASGPCGLVIKEKCCLYTKMQITLYTWPYIHGFKRGAVQTYYQRGLRLLRRQLGGIFIKTEQQTEMHILGHEVKF